MDESSKMPPPANPDSDTPLTKQEKVDIERKEEQKLKAKYPMGGNRPQLSGGGGQPQGGGHSAFLQKRLAKGQKYFDSGDYNMAKQKPRGVMGPGRLAMPVLAQPSTGDTIPTPELVPARKTSIIQPLHDHSQSLHVASDPAHVNLEPGRPMPNPAVTKLAS